MKFKEFVPELISEDVRNKRLFDQLMQKWATTYPILSTEEGQLLGEKIYNRHDAIKNSINPNVPAVISFLSRYDGLGGQKKYTLNDLKDITRLDINHLVEFLIEFGNFSIDLGGESEEGGESIAAKRKRIFNKEGVKVTDEKIEESKKMWYDESSAVVNEPNFRVYFIDSVATAKQMGYYYQELHKQVYFKIDKREILEPNGTRPNINAPWCVAGRGSEVRVNFPDGRPAFSHYTNMFANYRKNHTRTFYFIIDEDKNPLDKYYMSALQIDSHGVYRITSMYNDGDNPFSWEKVIDIYPKLANHKNVFKYKAWSDDELETNEVSAIDRINENEGSQYEFARQTLAVKNQYIDAGFSISKPKSWNSMNTDLKNKYIMTVDGANVTQKFSNMEFLLTVINTPGYLKTLERRLVMIGKPEGVKFIADNLLKTEFKLARTNLKNSKIVLYESRATKKFGIFNFEKVTWYELNNITYEPYYVEGRSEVYIDESGKKYLVNSYTKNGIPDDSSFYTVILGTGANIDAFFISNKKWKELETQIKPFGKYAKKFEYEPEKETDIEENLNY